MHLLLCPLCILTYLHHVRPKGIGFVFYLMLLLHHEFGSWRYYRHLSQGALGVFDPFNSCCCKLIVGRHIVMIRSGHVEKFFLGIFDKVFLLVGFFFFVVGLKLHRLTPSKLSLGMFRILIQVWKCL